LPFAALPVAAACALVPLASLRALAAPIWLAVTAALAVFFVLPLVWHLAAERRSPALTPRSPLDRLSLRALLLGLLVLAVSFGSLGPRQVGRHLLRLVPGRKATAPGVQATGPAPAPGSPSRRHDLESFIPADATLVAAASGSKAVQALLEAHHLDAHNRLTALEKCQIPIDSALVLLAARDRHTRLIVVRAPGITEVRNLYCLIGALGNGHVNLRFTSDRSPVRFDVEGLFAQTLRFVAVDDRTLVMSDGTWGTAADKKLFPPGADGAEGPLGAALDRIDRSANVWAASVAPPGASAWDLALEVRVEGTRLRLRATSTPPSGPTDRAELEMTVPSTFAAALPEAALEGGIRGVIAALTATGGGFSGPPTK
jgi:hypothetical protein